MPSALGEGDPISFQEPAYELSAGGQGDFDSPVLRVHYTSLTTPDTVIDYNMATGKRFVWAGGARLLEGGRACQ